VSVVPKRTKDGERDPEAGRLRLVQADSAAFSVDRDRIVVSWNEAAEVLTGVPAAEAIGRPCWLVLRGTDPDGHPTCSPRCPVAVALERDETPPSLTLVVGDGDGRRTVMASTLTVDVGGDLMTVHVLREVPHEPALRVAETSGAGPLTARQRQILSLLGEGFRAGQIAERLGLSEATVRNHISSILDRLGCHSQLEAVAEARRRGLL
jgi:DNA-binding CsgD family transcriptional regulator